MHTILNSSPYIPPNLIRPFAHLQWCLKAYLAFSLSKKLEAVYKYTLNDNSHLKDANSSHRINSPTGRRKCDYRSDSHADSLAHTPMSYLH